MFNGLLLNPRMNLKYELKVARLLERAVGRLDRIESVRYVKCSFPSVPTDAPQLQLRRWGSLDITSNLHADAHLLLPALRATASRSNGLRSHQGRA